MKIEVSKKDEDRVLELLIPYGGFFASPDGTFDVQPRHIGVLKSSRIKFKILDKSDTVNKRWMRIYREKSNWKKN
jgi:hypothetical protein